MTHSYDRGSSSTGGPEKIGGAVFSQRLLDAKARWQAKAKSIAVAQAGSLEEFCRRHDGVSSSTVTDKKSGLTLSTMLKWHDTGVFSLAEQIQVMFGLSDRDLHTDQPLWQPRRSTEHLLAVMRAALAESESTHPSPADLGQAVMRSSVETGDLGRWRYRVFDVPGGWQFRHVSQEAVEFMRWYGADTGWDEDPDRGRARELVEGPGVPGSVKQQWMNKTWARPEPIPTFAPEMPGDARQRFWDQWRYERTELAMRLDHHFSASRAGWAGGFAVQHMPLLRHRDQPNGRHLLLQGVPPAPVRVENQQHLPVVDTYGIRTIVLLGAAATGLGFVATFLAEALGWTRLADRDLISRITGRRASVAMATEKDQATYAFDTVRRDPPAATVLMVTLPYAMANLRAEHSRRLDAMERLLATPTVLPILLGCNDGTLGLWQQRQDLGSIHGTVSGVNNIAGNVRAAYDAWEAYFRDTAEQGAMSAMLRPTLPWAGPAVTLPEEQERASRTGTMPVPHWYRHPLIGDIHVRTAYEIARRLRHPYFTHQLAATPPRRDRDEPAADVVTRRLGFAPGSYLDTHEDALRDVTGDSAWEHVIHEKFDPLYDGKRPGDAPLLPGQVLSMTLLGAPWRKPA